MYNLIFIVGLEDIDPKMIDAYGDMIQEELSNIMEEENPQIGTIVTFAGELSEWIE